MTSCDDFIEKAKKELPDMCSTKDLVNFGIYKSEQTAHNARKKGLACDYFKMPHGLIIYPKKGVIELLEKSKHDCKKGLVSENYDTGRSYTQSTSSSHKKGLRL